MSQVMESHLTEPGLLEQPLENTMAEVVRIHEPAIFTKNLPSRPFFGFGKIEYALPEVVKASFRNGDLFRVWREQVLRYLHHMALYSPAPEL